MSKTLETLGDIYKVYSAYKSTKGETKRKQEEASNKAEIAKQEQELKKREMAIEEEMARNMPVAYAMKKGRLNKGGPVRNKKPKAGKAPHNKLY
jgi:hypothetical protein